jgi:hypothetical protein
MAANLSLFKSKMRTYKTSGRGSTINHAFASALATADVYDEETLVSALAKLGQSATDPLRCVYCTAPATSIDHLHGLVQDSSYTGHGHVIGNLVPCCSACNQSKGKTSWRDWAKSKGTPSDQIQRIADYESLAPPAVSQEDLKLLYPDLMAAYDRLRLLTRDMLKAADHLAKEIRRLESHRLRRRLDGGSADVVED